MCGLLEKQIFKEQGPKTVECPLVKKNFRLNAFFRLGMDRGISYIEARPVG